MDLNGSNRNGGCRKDHIGIIIAVEDEEGHRYWLFRSGHYPG